MKEFSCRIEDPNGLHARPAGQLATFAKRFLSDIRVRANGKEVDGKRLLALMSLGATEGTELSFSVSGEDEETAILALEVYCRSMNADAKSQADQKDGSTHAEP
ncbi:MAG: HPr family phosphocarrier protein [Ruminococcaceae bacterium]|nr:HPr family phosphocarrier protein [Oscillospiraceae bacterium]